MDEPRRSVDINISRIPVAGIGGLGLVAVAGVMAYTLPQTWWFLAASLAGGVVMAAAAIIVRRRKPLSQ